MALKPALIGLALIAPASAASASIQETGMMAPAPAGTPETLYCMRIEAITGSRLEKTKCWTRKEWAEQGVDVDHDWAKEGVRTIG